MKADQHRRPTETSAASLALANLRGFAIIMVVAFHACIAYLATHPAAPPTFDAPPYSWTGTPIIDRSRWLGFDIFCAFQFIYLMQLMFFLSGLFVWPSLARKGARAFMRERLIRLGLPFLLGVGVLMPLAYYPAYQLATADPSWRGYWAALRALPFWPSGPAWFLWFLLAMNVAAAALFAFAPRSRAAVSRLSEAAAKAPARWFIGVVIACALATMPLSAAYAPWQWLELFGPFAFQPSQAPQYLGSFAAGVLVGAQGLERGLIRTDGVLARCWGRLSALVPAAFLLWIIPTALIVGEHRLPGLRLAADLGLVLCAALSCAALLAVFLRFAAAPRPILGSFSEHAYGIYLFHYPFVVWLQLLLLETSLPALVKASTVLAVALGLSWSVSVAIDRLPLGRQLIGSRRRHGASAAE
jgi:peptidoglycan/LPS O-acetylase OafA/YrhL